MLQLYTVITVCLIIGNVKWLGITDRFIPFSEIIMIGIGFIIYLLADIRKILKNKSDNIKKEGE